MSEKKMNRTKILNLICAALMLVMIVLQFTPFWHFADGEEQLSASVNGYVWFPEDHKDLTKYLQAEVSEDFKVGQIVGAPIVQLVAGAAGIVLCLLRPKNPLVSLLPVIGGAAGVYGYLTHAALQLGSGWGLHLIVAAATLVTAAAALICALKKEN